MRRVGGMEGVGERKGGGRKGRVMEGEGRTEGKKRTGEEGVKVSREVES